MAEAVLVAGASGYLGSRLVAELMHRGVPVRALVRSKADPAVAALAAAGADVVVADATRPGALVGICDGCCAVASCMAADMRWSSGSPEAVDRDANIALFQEAAATASRASGSSSSSSSNKGSGAPDPCTVAGSRGGGRVSKQASSAPRGVQRFMLVATFEGREARDCVPLQSAKEAAVDFVEELAPEHGIAFYILRPTAYFRDFTDFPWRRMHQSNWMLVPGRGRARYNPIDGTELAAFMADCLVGPEGEKWANKEIRIGGPQVITFRDTIYAAAEALGKRRSDVWLIPVPVLALRAAAVLAGMLGMLWGPAARFAGALRFLVYSCSHDSVGMSWGSRTVADHYKSLMGQLGQQQLRQHRQQREGEEAAPLVAQLKEE